MRARATMCLNKTCQAAHAKTEPAEARCLFGEFAPTWPDFAGNQLVVSLPSARTDRLDCCCFGFLHFAFGELGLHHNAEHATRRYPVGKEGLSVQGAWRTCPVAGPTIMEPDGDPVP